MSASSPEDLPKEFKFSFDRRVTARSHQPRRILLIAFANVGAGQDGQRLREAAAKYNFAVMDSNSSYIEIDLSNEVRESSFEIGERYSSNCLLEVAFRGSIYNGEHVSWQKHVHESEIICAVC
jgi:hypothetical protein